MYTSVVLCEAELTDYECGQLIALHESGEASGAGAPGVSAPYGVHVVVPADTRQNPLVAAIDDVVMGDLKDAFRRRERVADAQTARELATRAVEASVARLRALGIEADGEITGDDPVPALADIAGRIGADELIVITQLHPVEDSLHRDWASRARHVLDVPVLHAVAGTDWVLD